MIYIKIFLVGNREDDGMKFIHLGDLHIGKSLGDFDLLEDQKYMLDQIIKLAKKQNVDGVFLAGDIYDRAIPSEGAVRILDYFLRELSANKIKTFMISGNHDSDDRLNFGSSFFEANEIYISAKYDGTLKKYTLTDEHGDLNIYLLPFVKASYVRYFYPEEQIDTYEQAVRTVLKHAKIDTTQRNIIVAHQFVIGKSEMPVLGGSEGSSAQNVGLVEQVGNDCFEEFDYVALGHIHSSQKIGREEVRYSGSLLKYSLKEANANKSIPLITLGKKGKVDIELIQIKPMRDVRHIKGPMKQLLKKENLVDLDDYIYATLTDEEIINDAMGIFQQYYPNTVKIDYDNSHTREIENYDISTIIEEKSFEELISDFYGLIYQSEMSEEEMKFMQEVARKAGVIHETN